MKKYRLYSFFVTLILFVLLFQTSAYCLQNVNVSKPVFSAEFNSGGLATTFGYFNLYQNRYFGGYSSGGSCDLSTAVDNYSGTLHFENDLRIPVQNAVPLADCYSYKRAEVVNRNAAKLNSKDGLTIQYSLKLSMSRLTSLTEGSNLGWTGFIVNVRDYLNGGIDENGHWENEFYLGIAAYQNGIVATSVSGNRNNLRNQTVHYWVGSDINPNEYHTYTWVYGVNGFFSLYVDGILRHNFGTNAVLYRVVYNGYYFNDYIGISLVNRTTNAVQSGSSYISSAEAWLDYIKIYNTALYRNSLIAISDPEINHSLYFTDISASIAATDSLNANEIDVYSQSLESQEMINLLTSSRIVLFRGHGTYDSATDTTGIVLYKGNYLYPDLKLYSSDINSASPDLSNTDVVMYVGCETALGDYNDPNKSLLRATKDAGAKIVIGFNTEIGSGYASKYSKFFFEYLEEGVDVIMASQYSYGVILNNWPYANFSVPVVKGVETLKYSE